MSKKRSKEKLKNIAYLVTRNNTKQEIVNVVFPNGLTVGLDDAGFANGLKVNGNTTIGGIVNARDVRVNGTSISAAGSAITFEPPVIIADAESGGRLSTPPSTAFTKVSVSSSETFTWGGHNSGRAVTSGTSYEVVSGDITGVCDNSSGTTLTAVLGSVSAEGDDDYLVRLNNGSGSMVLIFSVTKDSSGNAKFLVTSVGEHATGTEDWTSCIVTVPIKTKTATTSKSFTFQKNLPAAEAVTCSFTRSVIPVDTDNVGGKPVSGGDLADADISDQAFTKIDVNAGTTNVTFAGHNESGDPDSNTYKIVSDSITATTDEGTSLTAANSASEDDGSYNVTFSNGGSTRLTLAVSTDSSDAKLKVSSLAEHEDASNSDFNSVLVNVPIKVTTAAGTQTITRSFTVQKNKQGHNTPAVQLTRSVITIDTNSVGGRPVAGGSFSSGQVPDQAFTKVDVNAGTTNITFAGHNESGDPDSNTYKIVTDDMTATTDNGTSLTEANSASENDGSSSGNYDVTFANGGSTRLTLNISTDSSDAKIKVKTLAEHETGTTDFDSITVNVPIKMTTDAGTQTVTRSFTVQKVKAGSDGDPATAILSATGGGDFLDAIVQSGGRAQNTGGNYFIQSAPATGLFVGYRNMAAEVLSGSLVTGANTASTDPINLTNTTNVKKTAIFVMPANGKIHQIFGDITFQSGGGSGAIFHVAPTAPGDPTDALTLRAFSSGESFDDVGLTEEMPFLFSLPINNNATFTMNNPARGTTDVVTFSSAYSSSGTSLDAGQIVTLVLHNDAAGLIDTNPTSVLFNFTILYSLS